jgi:hypothetical protein
MIAFVADGGVVQLESMPGYKYPNIDSGATFIGSAGHAPEHPSLPVVTISSATSTLATYKIFIESSNES